MGYRTAASRDREQRAHWSQSEVIPTGLIAVIDRTTRSLTLTCAHRAVQPAFHIPGKCALPSAGRGQ